MSKNLTINLDPDTDRNGKRYFIGKLKFPGTINCKDGITFFVFIAEDGSEQLQIASMENKKHESR